MNDHRAKPWKLTASAAPDGAGPSGSQFDALVGLVETLGTFVTTLGDRITMQAQTIETLAQRIDQLQTAPSLLINGKPLADCTADEIDAAISRLMTRP